MGRVQTLPDRMTSGVLMSAGPGVETPEEQKVDGIRDTIESIIVALILAFVFRAFVVEAFVIPTGSMAPGLYGKHAQYRCSSCQYSFAYGISDPAMDSFGRLVAQGTLERASFSGLSLICPNCGWIDFANRQNPAKIESNSGDRILVLKWPYDIGGSVLGPQRWDVVVFKNPEDGDTNFIKRLLGLPGEVLEIVDGEVYTAPLASVDPDIQEALSKPPPSLAEGGSSRKRRLTADQAARLAKVLRIQRKTPIAQKSLWMVHYNHDYMPNPKLQSASPYYNPPRWEPNGEADAKAWDSSSPCVKFNPTDNQEYRLKLAGKPIQDGYGYNNVYYPTVWPSEMSGHPVPDAQVRFVLFPEENTEGKISLLYRKGQQEFVATLTSSGTAQLERGRIPTGGKDAQGLRIMLQKAENAVPAWRIDRPMEIEFEHLDYRVTLRVDGQEVVSTTDTQYSPDVWSLLRNSEEAEHTPANLELAAVGTRFNLRHLMVSRDVYYRSDLTLAPRNLQGDRNPYDGYPGWGTESNPILLRRDPSDYFCCGDNSPQSHDGRAWWQVATSLEERKQQIQYMPGTVPGDQMIGKAFYVYWPSGIRLTKETPGVIPNVGRMRIIR